MQSVYLVAAKGYSEMQVGVLLFVFGMSQFLCQTPAGYLFDSTQQKVSWLSAAGILTTLMTVLSAIFACDSNFEVMVAIKAAQGGISSFIPLGLNSITQGTVGSDGMTRQVAGNEMMNRLGTAVMVIIGSLIAFAQYPIFDSLLLVVSPIACIGFLYCLNQIKSSDIDHDVARGLVAETGENDGAEETGVQSSTLCPRTTSPLELLKDPTLLLFVTICFLFHLTNGTILPLVRQILAIGNGRSGILLNGMSITTAQLVMAASANVCDSYSSKHGRKMLFLIALGIVPIRCAILAFLLTIKGFNDAGVFLRFLILSTQVLDGIGAGLFGTMYILVSSDISGGTGRFGLTLGLATAAMSIGGIVSRCVGQALAEYFGYVSAFWILMDMSVVPTLMYLIFMPEILGRKQKIGVFREEKTKVVEFEPLVTSPAMQ
eukprot:scaffold24509_cov127-Cylindrotheca_fusiformis.AAC.4